MYFWSWCSKGDEKSLGVQKRLSGRVQVVPVCFHVIVSNTALLLDYCWVFNRKKKHSSLWGFFCSYCWHAFIIIQTTVGPRLFLRSGREKRVHQTYAVGHQRAKRSWYIYSELEGQPQGHFIPFFFYWMATLSCFVHWKGIQKGTFPQNGA